MPQPPFLIDQIDIEPGSAGTRRINRDVGTGGLAFQDAVVTTPITLSQLASLNAIPNVLVVGKSGAGAKYTTIQSALDVVPSSASALNPYIVLVLPGVYTETVNIVRDGVRLVGIGQPVIESLLEAVPDAPGADHTVIISAQLGTIPLSIIIQGFTITNAHINKACIRIVGGAASTVGSTGILIRDCNLAANSAAGNRNIWAATVNRVLVDGGSWSEANNTGLLLIQEVAFFRISGVRSLGAVDLRYNTANDQPSQAATSYQFIGCGSIAESTALGTPVGVELAGAGSLVVDSCVLRGQSNFAGDQSVSLHNCIVDALLLTGTVACRAENSTIKSIVAPAAGATLDVRALSGSGTLAAATTVDVSFDVPMSDASFEVALEMPSQPANDEAPWITNKLATGFRINFATNQTMVARWRATRGDV